MIDKSENFKRAELEYEKGNIYSAIKIFKQLTEEEPESLFELYFIYKYEESLEDNEKISTNYLELYISRIKALSEYTPYYAYKLGRMYLFGDGVEPSYKEGLVYLYNAAEKNISEAQFLLSTIFKRGDYSKNVDMGKSLFWLEKAVANNHPEAQYTKALYLLESGIASDTNKARQLLIRASTRGFWPAQEVLDSM